MNRSRLEKAPWVVPWQYVSTAHSFGWMISKWMYRALAGSSFLLGFSLGLLLDMPWLGMVMALFFAYVIPGELLEGMRRHRHKKMRLQWIETIRSLHSSYLLCNEWRQAINMSLPYVPDEIREVLDELLRREKLGLPMEQVWMELRNQFPLPEMKIFLEVIQLLEKVGGQGSEMLLDDVVSWLEESGRNVEEMENEVGARQTETRHLFMLFLAETLFFRIMGSAYFDSLFHSMLGQLFISGLFVLNCVCLLWIRLRIKALEIRGNAL